MKAFALLPLLLCAVASDVFAAPAAKDLALPANGGTIVWFTSRDNGAQLAHLTDDKTDTPGWRSKDKYLPQDIVFAFAGDRVATVERLALNPKSRHPVATWPTNVLVSVSTNTPLDGFEPAGEFALAPEPREQEFRIARPAKFLKLRFTHNSGGPFTSLGEVKIFGTIPTNQAGPVAISDSATTVAPRGATDEAEPNNSAAQANTLPLGQPVRGAIDPPGETDFYNFAVAAGAPNVVTFELIGWPNVRTSLDLLDAAAQVQKSFDPGKTPAQRAGFSWLVKPGEQFVRLTEPAVSLVLVWDTSDSMKNDLGKLQQAVEAYLDAVGPGERLKLVRFSKDVEVITPEWTSDRKKLRELASGKFKPINGTSCYDAFTKAASLLDGVPGNRGIVLMTDGADTSSQLDHPGFWRALDAKRIRLYTIALGSGMKRYTPATGTVAERVLNHAALASNGRSFFTTNAAELKKLYETIAAELRATSGYELQATLSAGHGLLGITTSGEPIATIAAPPQIELILDCSGSMTLDAGGRPRMTVAKAALSRIIEELPDNVRVALRFYGHRIEDGRPGACEDSELVVPFGPVDKPAVLAKVRDVKPVGTTPIAWTLCQLTNDFAGLLGDKVVVLVTDGREECKGDLGGAIRDVRAAGIDLRLEIVGFALNDRTAADRKAKKELESIAAATGGAFHDAKNAQSLDLALQASLAVPFDVLDAAGEKVAGGLTGQGDLKVPEGVFTVAIRAGDAPIMIPNVRIVRERPTKVSLRKEGQEVGVQVQGP